MKNFTFDLMGHDIHVVFDIDPTHRPDIWGEWLPLTGTIRLPVSAPSGILQDTFLHELVHAVTNLTGIELPEQHVQCLGLGLGHALRNRKVLALLSEENA